MIQLTASQLEEARCAALDIIGLEAAKDAVVDRVVRLNFPTKPSKNDPVGRGPDLMYTVTAAETRKTLEAILQERHKLLRDLGIELIA